MELNQRMWKLGSILATVHRYVTENLFPGTEMVYNNAGIIYAVACSSYYITDAVFYKIIKPLRCKLINSIRC